MNWDCNPKQRFTRNHLEKCYTTTSKNNRPVEKMPEREEPMGYKKRPNKEPYWNFWRAVFAGWMIRYPKQIFKVVGIVILIPVLSILTMCSSPSENRTNNYDTQSTYR